MLQRRLAVPFHALVAVLLTWPLVLHLGDSLPYGTEPVQTVPLFNLWTLRWNQLQIGDLYRHYWDAPIFHPTAGAFALSEPQPLTGLFFAPISWATHNPGLAYDLTLLTILTLNGIAAARLARRIGVAPMPALLAGVLAQALPFVSNQLGVLQLTVLFPIFLLVDALLQWAPNGGRRPAIMMGVWLAATFLTCGYYGLFVVVVIGPASLVLVRRSWFTVRRLLDVVAALATFVVLALPFLIGQANYTSGYTRSDATIEALSATAIDFVRLHPDTHGASLMPWLSDTGGTDHFLYPGTVLLGLALAGLTIATLASARVRAPVAASTGDEAPASIDPSAADPDADTDAVADAIDGPLDVSDARRRVSFLMVAPCLALLLSLGLRLDLGGFRPYDLIRFHVPGFRDLRSPFRFAILVQIFLVPLAAFALDALWTWRPTWAGRRLAAGVCLSVALVGLGVIEVSPVPQRLFVVPDPGGDWVTWLQQQPPPDQAGGAAATGDGSVAMVPFPDSGNVAAYEPTAKQMLSGLEHGHPLANGYSGLFPASYDELNDAMLGFPSERSVRELREMGITYVVVERSWLTPEAQGWMDDWSQELTPAFQGHDQVVYRLNR